jgi:hypothetical protein
MKKLIFCTLFAAVSVLSVAQSFQKGNKLIGVGYTFGISGYENTKFTFPPLFGQFEYALTDKLSLGVSVDYNRFTYTRTYDQATVGGGNLLPLLQGSYHAFTTDKLDPYISVLAGYNFYYSGATVASSTLNPDIFVAGAALGARYYLTQNIGLFAEGSALLLGEAAYLKVGVCVKL